MDFESMLLLSFLEKPEPMGELVKLSILFYDSYPEPVVRISGLLNRMKEAGYVYKRNLPPKWHRTESGLEKLNEFRAGVRRFELWQAASAKHRQEPQSPQPHQAS
jgi:hypothetical protein